MKDNKEKSNLRKVEYINDSYQLLKPKGTGWHSYGERKSLKAIRDIKRNGKFKLVIPDYVEEQLKGYELRETERREAYLNNKNIISKVI